MAVDMQRVRAGLGGSHTVVTYPPLDVLSQGAVTVRTPEAGYHLYIHIAFCEFACGFCHYQKSIVTAPGAEGVSSYVDALIADIGRLLDRNSQVQSVYIGGGTPTSVPEHDLLRILGVLERRVRDFNSIPVNVECSPLTMCGDKGNALARQLQQSGVNRLSMGVQTFDEALLPRLRGHTLSQLDSAICNIALWFPNWNVDLIQDLPGQSDASIVNDCQSIGAYSPPQVSWYILRLHPGSSWYRTWQSSPGRIALAPTPASVERRLCVVTELTRLGYVRSIGGRFLRGAPEDQFKRVRGELTSDLVGIGASAYSHIGSAFFRNGTAHNGSSGIRAYADAANDGSQQIGVCWEIGEDDRCAAEIIAGLRTRLSKRMLDAAPEVERQDWARCLEKLEDMGVVEADEDAFSLSDRGLAFEEEVCSLFYPRNVRNSLRARGAYWATEEWFQ